MDPTQKKETQHAQEVTNAVPGEPLTTESQLLDTSASMTQDFSPIKNVCAVLNAFHVYADDRSKVVEASHYCSHLNEDFRQCLIYDSNAKNARLIGVEYMISPKVYETLEPEERLLWHSHVFEVKSGMLIMPKPHLVPETVWEVAENKEMEDLVQVYGKTYHMWQVDRGDKLPLGAPKLMTSVTESDVTPGLWEKVAERDKKLGSDYKRKTEVREKIKSPKIHPDADHWTAEKAVPKEQVHVAAATN
ncbi:hypothetical protein BDZ97DRAFT_1917286 [Flammula alnicola]|nr:hypothetical protein BDZ97DRAFT_1917286 [Flammula alnicola]